MTPDLTNPTHALFIAVVVFGLHALACVLCAGIVPKRALWPRRCLHAVALVCLCVQGACMWTLAELR